MKDDGMTALSSTMNLNGEKFPECGAKSMQMDGNKVSSHASKVRRRGVSRQIPNVTQVDIRFATSRMLISVSKSAPTVAPSHQRTGFHVRAQAMQK